MALRCWRFAFVKFIQKYDSGPEIHWYLIFGEIIVRHCYALCVYVVYYD